MNKSLLRPFRGFLIPGMYFSTGYCLMPLNFSSTPTNLGAYSEIWLITPEGKRILYVDPEAAGDIVCTFHHCHEVVAASLDWEWSTPEKLHIGMEAKNSSTLDMQVILGSSLGTGVLNAVIKFVPQKLMMTRTVMAFSEICLNMLLGLGGLKIAGRFETGKAYVNQAEHLAVVKEATAKLNGSDLGELTRPLKPILFGQFKVPNRALFCRGILHLEYAES